MKIKYLFLTPFVFFLCTSCTSQAPFKQLKYNWQEDIISQIAPNFKPFVKNSKWTLLEANNFDKKVRILYSTSDISKKNFEYRANGFLNECHPLGCAYYIVVENDKDLIYITEVEQLYQFFGAIDSYEEALLIAIINGFSIDSFNPKGSSYRKSKIGYEFLLKRSDPIALKFTQYHISVDKIGEIKFENKGVYCEGINDCFGR